MTKVLATSSSGEPYDVAFDVIGECVSVFCNCQAGVQQWMCKHKTALIAGDIEMLFDPAQAPLLAEIRAWPQFPRLEARIARYLKELAEIESTKADVTKREKSAKAQIGKDLTRGKYDA